MAQMGKSICHKWQNGNGFLTHRPGKINLF